MRDIPILHLDFCQFSLYSIIKYKECVHLCRVSRVPRIKSSPQPNLSTSPLITEKSAAKEALVADIASLEENLTAFKADLKAKKAELKKLDTELGKLEEQKAAFMLMPLKKRRKPNWKRRFRS